MTILEDGRDGITGTPFRRPPDIRDKLLAEQGKTATLEAEVRELDAQLEDRTARVLASSKEKCRYEAKALGYLDLLRELEWNAWNHTRKSRICVACKSLKGDGHTEHCALGNALKEK